MICRKCKKVAEVSGVDDQIDLPQYISDDFNVENTIVELGYAHLVVKWRVQDANWRKKKNQTYCAYKKLRSCCQRFLDLPETFTITVNQLNCYEEGVHLSKLW